MSKVIKLTVSTGWAGGDHVDYWDLPGNWDSMSDGEKEETIHEYSKEYLEQCCDAYGEVVDDSEVD